jgi:hypothetical protein
MIAETIRWILTNATLVLCVAAVICAALSRAATPWPRRYLAWLLLLGVGMDGIWAGIFHVFFPAIASAQIGWQPSPFEAEIGVADMSMGIVAVIAFWRSLSFQSAIAVYAALFFTGVSIGHFVQAFGHGNFAPDNFGVMLILTLARIVALGGLLWAAWRTHPHDLQTPAFGARPGAAAAQAPGR